VLEGSFKRKFQFKVRFAGKVRDFVVKSDSSSIDLGTWKISKKGYQKLTLKNSLRSVGWLWARPHPNAKEDSSMEDNKLISVKVTGVGEMNYCPVDDHKSVRHGISLAHWCRRGPTATLWHKYAKNIEVKYWYSELKVPKGQDTSGAYFMANGFNVGYLGMQVNTATERRVLFSVWSPFATDDPTEIPED